MITNSAQLQNNHCMSVNPMFTSGLYASVPRAWSSTPIDMPQRIQRQRSRGWQLAPNTEFVGRPTKWGNPFRVHQARAAGYRNSAAMTVYAYRQWLRGDPGFTHDLQASQTILNSLSELRGFNLCCWCGPDEPCHADVLLELANQAEARAALVGFRYRSPLPRGHALTRSWSGVG